jgi:hypothetical protein
MDMIRRSNQGMLRALDLGRSRLRCAEGIAMPVVLIALVAAFALASVTVIASVTTQGGTTRDQNTKAALAAADAGVSNAMLRYNTIKTTSAADVCAPVGGTAASGAGGWCPQQVTGAIDRGAYAFMVKPTATEIEIVSRGTVDGVSRRVDVVARSSGGIQPFGSAGVIGLDYINLNSNANLNANLATNGDITLNSNSAINCNYAQIGVGHQVIQNANTSISCPAAQGTISLPPVNPGDVATNNSNGRICNLDPISGELCAQAWNPATKVLQLNSNSSITLGSSGGTYNYFFCQLTLNSNSSLYIAGGATVRIYFGTPDTAPCLNQASPLNLNSNAKILPTGAGPVDIALLVVGSDTKATNITLNSNTQLISCPQSFVLYAPRSALTFNSNNQFCGGLAAKSLLFNSNSGGVNNAGTQFQLPNTVAGHYDPEEYVECSTAAVTPPDAEC